MLGASGAWLMSHLSQQAPEPANLIVDCQFLEPKARALFRDARGLLTLGF